MMVASFVVPEWEWLQPVDQAVEHLQQLTRVIQGKTQMAHCAMSAVGASLNEMSSFVTGPSSGFDSADDLFGYLSQGRRS